MDDVNWNDTPADWDDTCSICGAEPMDALCNNANCWDRVINDERTDDED